MSLPAADTDIGNMAISHLGSGKEMDAMDTERSQEASACRRFYDTALQTTLRDYDWGFARTIEALTLVQDFTPVVYPNDWNYSYRYPTDAICVRRIQSGNRTDTLDSAVPWELRTDNSGILIMTDMGPITQVTAPYVKYTRLVTAIEQYPTDFTMAFSLLLAHLIAPRLTNGDPLGLGMKCYQRYLTALSMAQKNNEIEGNPDLEHDSEFVRTRDC